MGDLVLAFSRCMGLKKGEKSKHLAMLQGAHLGRERLEKMAKQNAYRQAECLAEGFPYMEGKEFVEIFYQAIACHSDAMVTRIQFRYFDE